MEEYAMYANKALPKNYCTVTEDLRRLLEEIADNITVNETAPDYENRWLQFCEYYDAYGTNGKQLSDPVAGIAIFSALDVIENDASDTNTYPNSFVYDRLVGTPRGMFAKFTPTVSGVYLVESSDLSGTGIGDNFEMLGVDGWIFDENKNIIYTYKNTDRIQLSAASGDVNEDGDIEMGAYDVKVFMKVYLEAGVDYYINIAFQDYTAFGTVHYQVRKIGEAGYSYIDKNGNRIE
jgi:hypothetical protein